GRRDRGLYDLDRAAVARVGGAAGPRDDQLQVVRRRGGREALELEPRNHDLVVPREVAGDVEDEGLAGVLVAHRGRDLARPAPRDRGRRQRRVPGRGERRGDPDTDVV